MPDCCKVWNTFKGAFAKKHPCQPNYAKFMDMTMTTAPLPANKVRHASIPEGLDRGVTRERDEPWGVWRRKERGGGGAKGARREEKKGVGLRLAQ